MDKENSIATATWCESENTYKDKVMSIFYNQVSTLSLKIFGEPASLQWVEILSSRETDTLFDIEHERFVHGFVPLTTQ